MLKLKLHENIITQKKYTRTHECDTIYQRYYMWYNIKYTCLSCIINITLYMHFFNSSTVYLLSKVNRGDEV